MALTSATVVDWPPNIAEDLSVAVIVSRFNGSITERLKAICCDTLVRYGVVNDRLTLVTVPGALEIPFAAAVLADSGRFDGLIGLGCVLRGETAHFDIVANESARGLMQIQLDHCLPAINGILTVDTVEQAEARINAKATDSASSLIEMVLWQRSVDPTISSLHRP